MGQEKTKKSTGLYSGSETTFDPQPASSEGDTPTVVVESNSSDNVNYECEGVNGMDDIRITLSEVEQGCAVDGSENAEEAVESSSDGQEGIISGEVSEGPWGVCDIEDSSGDISSRSPPRPWRGGRFNDDGDGEESTSDLTCSLQVDCEEEMPPTPTVTGAGMQAQPSLAAAAAKPPIIKNVHPNQNKGKNAAICTHITKASSQPGLRKAIKQDIKLECSQAIKNPPCASEANFKWMCLQCGNISCGNASGMGGHAFEHQKVPRSDLHVIAVKLVGGLDIAWCYACNMELDTNSTFFKESITLLRRNAKVKMALSANQIPQPVGPAIALGPPPPPPIPKLEAPKGFFANKAKPNQAKVTPSTSFSLKGSGDWPMGLENLGNTCFMNSALQCLSRTRSLLNKLDLYGSGNVIEILVTHEEPYVQVINDNVQGDENGTDFVSDECEKFMMEGRPNDARIEDLAHSICSTSPQLGDMDRLLEAAKSKDEEGPEVSQWSKELEQELKKPLRLRLSLFKDSMTSKLRHCFKAITRTADLSSGDTYERSEFHCRSNNFPSVYNPRPVQLGVSRHFRLGQQHDSHELLRTVVDMMKKDQIKAFRLAIMQRYGVKRTEGKNCDPKVAELLKMWDRKLYHKTCVDEIFGGSLVTIQQCIQCKSVKHSHEEFLDLSLPIRVFRANPNPSRKKTYSLFDDDYDYAINRSLEECLKAYTEPEFLTGSNAVECENCHRINLERLAEGASFEEVFPGVKIEEMQQPSTSSGTTNNKKSKYSNNNNKKQPKKRPSRQAKIKSRLDQSSNELITQDDCDVDGTGSSPSSMAIVEDHFDGDQSNPTTSTGVTGNGEEDGNSSKSGSLDDYVVIQSTPMIKKQGNESNITTGPTEMDLGYVVPQTSEVPNAITGDDDDNVKTVPSVPLQPGNGGGDECERNLSRGLSTSLKSLSLADDKNAMDVEEGEGGGTNVQEEVWREWSQQPDDYPEYLDNGAKARAVEDEVMDDLDELAVDGVGNASDIEDEDDNRGNGISPLDLAFIEDSNSKPPCITDFLSVPAEVATAASSTVADEGFSEGENSSEEKNSQSLSGSSSRNSISEVEGAVGGALVESPNETPAKKIPVTKCPCSRQQLISRPPECLTLHLKRFQHTGRGSSKLNDKVAFPYILNLTKFCSQVGENTSRPGYNSIFDEDGEVVYSLYGIVEHSGSLHFGHYVAYVKVPAKPNDSSSFVKDDDKWYYISDSHVSSSVLSDVLSVDAYILFYERIRGEEKKTKCSAFFSIAPQQMEDGTDNGISEWDSSSKSAATSSSFSFNYKGPDSNSETESPVTYGPQLNENWEDQPAPEETSSNDPESTTKTSSTFTNNSVNVSSSNTITLNYPFSETNVVSSSTEPENERSAELLGAVGTSASANQDNLTPLELLNIQAVLSANSVSASSKPLWDSIKMNDLDLAYLLAPREESTQMEQQTTCEISSSNTEKDELESEALYTKFARSFSGSKPSS